MAVVERDPPARVYVAGELSIGRLVQKGNRKLAKRQ